MCYKLLTCDNGYSKILPYEIPKDDMLADEFNY